MNHLVERVQMRGHNISDDLRFTSFLTVFRLHLDARKVIMIDCT